MDTPHEIRKQERLNTFSSSQIFFQVMDKRVNLKQAGRVI